MTRLSLKARLLLVLALALAPAMTLGAVRAREKLNETAAIHGEAAATAIEVAMARHRQVIEATRQLLYAVAEDEELSPWATGDTEAPDYARRCEAHLSRILDHFRAEYSDIIMMDETGVGRCSNAGAARGMRFDDRDYFSRVRETRNFFVGQLTASRVSPLNIQPAAVPIVRNGEVRGLVVVGVSLNWFANLVSNQRKEVPVYLSLVDRSGQPMSTSVDGAATLPRPARIVESLNARLAGFRDYSRSGERYDYRMSPLGYGLMLVVAAVPVSAQGEAQWGLWVDLIMILLSSAIAHGAPPPPKPPPGSSTPEMEALTEDVYAMASSIQLREGELQANLKQREHMLREIHHRVKNNLQMISSLLSLQAEKIRSPRIMQLFADAQNRLLTLSILHRHLYERSNWSSVDFQAYINDLVRHLSANRLGKEVPDVKFTVRAPVWNVGPDTAIPVGLIVTEAVANAFAHAFAGVADPEVRIIAEESGADWEVTIEDNGIGLGASFDIDDDEQNGLGVMLMRGLAVQLGGELSIAGGSGGGTSVRVRFPRPVPPSETHPLDRREINQPHTKEAAP